jgi:hypothetical protein
LVADAGVQKTPCVAVVIGELQAEKNEAVRSGCFMCGFKTELRMKLTSAGFFAFEFFYNLGRYSGPVKRDFSTGC